MAARQRFTSAALLAAALALPLPALAFLPQAQRLTSRYSPAPYLSESSVDVDDIERRAVAASEAWAMDPTPFLLPDDIAVVEGRLSGRADCSFVRAGGYNQSVRTRIVLTNPELGLTEDVANEEHCVVLKIDGADLSASDPLPNILGNIGVNLDDVGDIVVGKDGSAYLIVAPGAAKPCSRLLPKVLAGRGITVAPLEPGESVPEDGDLQDMEVQRLDKREQKRRK